ncbi:MAG: 2-hydroxycarboxylate transporter family protein [Eubacteriales bacterium]|nr:2-hydroxycarboxylate transporter family protein [Eubacteriales bacterium]
MEKKKGTQPEIMGIPLYLYLMITAVVCLNIMMGWLPTGMLGALAVMMLFGGLFNALGNSLPVVRSYLGGGAMVCIFASALLVYTGLLPAEVADNVASFMNHTGFLNFYIAALITGSILGMERTLLLRAAVRFLPVAVCAMTMAVLAVGFVGMLTGYGFADAVMYVAIPMMGGGMGAGVVPLSGMYAEALGTDGSAVISRMIPASALGNVTAIVGAGLLDRLGEARPSWSGNGRLMKAHDPGMRKMEEESLTLENLAAGLITAVFFFLLGIIVNKLVSQVHAYAWMIILVALGKAAGIVPKQFETAAKQWSQLVMKCWTSALLVGIGISMIDLQAVFAAFSPMYLLLVFVVVGGVALGAGLGGYLVGFFPVEAAVAAGLCTTNMGGTGDIAVLSAAKRMELLPFAQISTRICGALTLIAASLLIRILF